MMLNPERTRTQYASPLPRGGSGDIGSISTQAFERFRTFIYERAGISLAQHKRHLVSARVQKRLRQLGLNSFDAYLEFVSQPGQNSERQHLIDLLTTNETYFYREPDHFEYLMANILPAYRGCSVRVWSAACSSGEEVYTLAMVMMECLGLSDWQIFGSDISSRMIEAAQTGLYPLDRAKKLPPEWLKKYCLKGVRSQTGKFLVTAKLRVKARFERRNLLQLTDGGETFDVVFLRNVLIYFDQSTKQNVVNRIARRINPGGYLFLSHTESLHGIDTSLQAIQPSIFRKPV